jgi:hypothetical protein
MACDVGGRVAAASGRPRRGSRGMRKALLRGQVRATLLRDRARVLRKPELTESRLEDRTHRMLVVEVHTPDRVRRAHGRERMAARRCMTPPAPPPHQPVSLQDLAHRARYRQNEPRTAATKLLDQPRAQLSRPPRRMPLAGGQAPPGQPWSTVSAMASVRVSPAFGLNCQRCTRFGPRKISSIDS